MKNNIKIFIVLGIVILIGGMCIGFRFMMSGVKEGSEADSSENNGTETVSARFAEYIDANSAGFLVDSAVVTVYFYGTEALNDGSKYAGQAEAVVKDSLQKAKSINLEFELSDGSRSNNAWIWVDGELLQKKLIDAGLAVLSYNAAGSGYYEELNSAIEKAKADKIGMWSEYQSFLTLPDYAA